MLSAGTTYRHNSATTILHRGLHIREVGLYLSVERYEFRDTTHSIRHNGISPAKSLIHRDMRIAEHLRNLLIIDDKQGIHIGTHLIKSLESLDNLRTFLKIERKGYYANGQESEILSNTSHQRTCTCTSTTTHSTNDECHLGMVAEKFLQFLNVLLGLFPTLLWVSPCPMTALAKHNLGRHGIG